MFALLMFCCMLHDTALLLINHGKKAARAKWEGSSDKGCITSTVLCLCGL